jgi:O-antigen ligase
MTLVQHRAPSRAEWWFAVIALIYFSGAMVLLLPNTTFSSTGGAYTGSRAYQIIGAILYLVTFSLISLRFGLFLAICNQNKLLLLLVGFALASTFWSVDPGVTVRRVVALFATTAFGLYLVMRYTPEEFCRLLAWTLGILAVLSLAFAVALPQYGTHTDIHAGLWRGVFSHKNGAGRYMGLAAVLFVALALQGGKGHRLAWAGAGLSIFLQAMSGSRTGWLLTGCTLLVLILLQIFRKTHRSIAIPGVILGGLVLAGGALWATANLETVMPLIGRNATLTGRTYIWSVVIEQADSDWLGYGYNGFWYSPIGKRMAFLWLDDRTSNAHNGYLELWLDLGYTGIVLFLLTVLVCLRRLIVWLISTNGGSGLALPTALVYTLLSTVPSVIMQYNTIHWILYVAIFAYLACSRTVVGVTLEKASLEPMKV